MSIVICSHDCEIEQIRDRAGLLIAPLTPPPKWPPGDERWPILHSCTVPNEAGAYSFIHWFPVELDVGEGEATLMVADFSRIVSAGAGSKAKAKLLPSKSAEMTDEARNRFKNKIAAFFSRP